jgi:hypothetical protein
LSEKFIIYHKTAPPAHYDVIIDRGDSLVTFRMAQFDMLALLDGTEVRAEEVTDQITGNTPHNEPISCDRGEFRLFDSGTCSIEQWGNPVIVLNIVGNIFSGTLHLLKTPDCFSMRYIRSRTSKKAP